MFSAFLWQISPERFTDLSRGPTAAWWRILLVDPQRWGGGASPQSVNFLPQLWAVRIPGVGVALLIYQHVDAIVCLCQCLSIEHHERVIIVLLLQYSRDALAELTSVTGEHPSSKPSPLYPLYLLISKLFVKADRRVAAINRGQFPSWHCGQVLEMLTGFFYLLFFPTGTLQCITYSLYSCDSTCTSTSWFHHCSQGQDCSSSRPSKVIDLGANRKRICNFLLVISVVKLWRYLVPFSRY